MNTTQTVNNQVSRMKLGQLFSYKDIPEYSLHSEAVVKALSRNANDLGVVKLKKGLYYKAEKGRFGLMSPKDSDLIKYFTLEKNRVVGYITGAALYHRWGLTTQVPAEITIATSANKREKVEVAGLRIKTVPARTKVTKSSIPMLQFLDVLKNIDHISDSSPEEVMLNLSKRIKGYTFNEIEEMEKIAIRSYTPRTKALLGAFLESHRHYFSKKLHQALNPTSKYNILKAYISAEHQEAWSLRVK